jgi:hypothetical protein
LRAGGRYAQPWRLELAEPEPLAAAHAPAADQMIRTLPATKMLPNSQRIVPLETSDKWGTRGLRRYCLIHPVTPLLSLLAPLFQPFFSPVRGVPDGANLRFKPLESCGFCTGFRHPAGRKGVFPPVIWAKTGERR